LHFSWWCWIELRHVTRQNILLYFVIERQTNPIWQNGFLELCQGPHTFFWSSFRSVICANRSFRIRFYCPSTTNMTSKLLVFITFCWLHIYKIWLSNSNRINILTEVNTRNQSCVNFRYRHRVMTLYNKIILTIYHLNNEVLLREEKSNIVWYIIVLKKEPVFWLCLCHRCFLQWLGNSRRRPDDESRTLLRKYELIDISLW
jgi:hypothetical protein